MKPPPTRFIAGLVKPVSFGYSLLFLGFCSWKESTIFYISMFKYLNIICTLYCGREVALPKIHANRSDDTLRLVPACEGIAVLIAQLHHVHKVTWEHSKDHWVIHSVVCVRMSIDGTWHHVTVGNAASLTMSAKVYTVGCLFSIWNNVSYREWPEMSR